MSTTEYWLINEVHKIEYSKFNYLEYKSWAKGNNVDNLAKEN